MGPKIFSPVIWLALAAGSRPGPDRRVRAGLVDQRRLPPGPQLLRPGRPLRARICAGADRPGSAPQIHLEATSIPSWARRRSLGHAVGHDVLLHRSALRAGVHARSPRSGACGYRKGVAPGLPWAANGRECTRISNSLPFDLRLLKINKQGQSKARRFQIVDALGDVLAGEASRAFQLDQEPIFDD